MDEIYNKLVRDRIIEIIENNKETPLYHQLNHEEYWEALLEKDKEELEEVRTAKNNIARRAELADKLELIRAMSEYLGFSLEEIIEEANMKRELRGGFDKRLFLEKVIKK